jgi:hypothetical protein
MLYRWREQMLAGLPSLFPDDLVLMDVGRGQVHLGNHTWPTQTHVQPKAVGGLAAGMVFAKAVVSSNW